MMKHILAPIALTALGILVIGLFIKHYSPKISSTKEINPPSISSDKKQAKINNIIIDLEIADSSLKRQKGLSNRESLDENSGMLFVFEQKNITPTFWMKDMKFPIDILWIDDDKVIEITKDVQTETDQKNLILYQPNQPIDYVLEVNAGFSEKNNIKPGNPIELNLE